MEVCETCKYYKEKSESQEGASEASGYCNRYPRVPMVATCVYFYVPEVDKDDWCGEWIQKTEE